MQNKANISLQTKKILGQLLYLIGQTEIQIEFSRQNLCKAPSFEPYAAFQRIDRQSNGFITAADINKFVSENGISDIKPSECTNVIHFFDSKRNGHLDYPDFLQLVLPCDQQYLRAQATQRQTYDIQPGQKLPYDVEHLLCRLVCKELKLARESEVLKQSLASRYDYSLPMLFSVIDDWNYRFIDQTNLKRFMVVCGIIPADGLLLSIIRRMDIDADAKLSLKEFKDSIRPHENFSIRKSVKAGPTKHNEPSLLKRNNSNLKKSRQMKDLSLTDGAFRSCKQSFNKSILKNQTVKSDLINDIQIGSKEIAQDRKEDSQAINSEVEKEMVQFVRNVFQDILDLENGFELTRKSLALTHDFCLGAAHNLFATRTQVKLDLDTFLFGLSRLDIDISDQEGKLLFERYDSNQSGYLSFQDFSNILLPVEVRLRDEIEQRTQTLQMSPQTKQLMITTIKEAIRLEYKLESIRNKINKNTQMPPLRQIFESIDIQNKGFLTKSDVHQFIQKYRDHLSEVTVDLRSLPESIEMESFFRRFNHDKHNGTISIPEFIQQLTIKLL